MEHQHHGFVPTLGIASPDAGESQLAVSLEIVNFVQVSAVYGVDAALQVATELTRRIAVLGVQVEIAPGGARINLLAAVPRAVAQDRRDDQVAMFLEDLLVALSLDPVVTGQGEIVPVLHILGWCFAGTDGPRGDVSLDDLCAQFLEESGAARTCALQVVGFSAAACAQYRDDMRVAASLVRQARKGELFLAWQAIATDARHQDESDHAYLYSEGLLRGVSPRGDFTALGEAVASLERLGLVRVLDRHLVLQTIERLRANPLEVLGCNISAQSALLDVWWSTVVSHLEADPGLARRLVIEITETATLPDISLSVAFCDRLKSLGCRIAIDDFGTGHAAFRTLLTLRPDIIKIDAIFLNRALLSEYGAEFEAFRHLIGLAMSFAAHVVVEGIETSAGLALARKAGACSFQGYHIGTPGLSARRDQPYLEGFGVEEPAATDLGPWGGTGRARGRGLGHIPVGTFPTSQRLAHGVLYGTLLALPMWYGAYGFVSWLAG
ncbi:EAL domain-containing protein [Sphingobium sp. B12D2B]|uniref:EAL domain-containing protein n=1 Tax=Sphingobium sp. B12D2B TaxID=2940577 RepID=UPI00222566B2|nr:EAL domain-containing protein [Sphingobium sp. B12D2B]MCW2351810.1 EAL domain-containing protein (putative c-di-GMP-specific phosphodiesterase class I) [Sphingobium sp. B12D2B]